MKIFVFAIGLVSFIGLVAGHGNPCPQHWHYVNNNGEIEGRVTFKHPKPAEKYDVKLYLSVKGQLKSVSAFSASLSNSIDFFKLL